MAALYKRKYSTLDFNFMHRRKYFKKPSMLLREVVYAHIKIINSNTFMTFSRISQCGLGVPVLPFCGNLGVANKRHGL